MRHLLEKPVRAIIALADCVGDVIREQQGVAQVPTPQPVIRPVTLEKLSAGAVGIAYLPDLFSVTHGLPVQLAQVQRPAGFNDDIRLHKFTQHPVRKCVQRICARADVGNGEPSVFSPIVPELVIRRIVHSIGRRTTTATSTTASAACVVHHIASTIHGITADDAAGNIVGAGTGARPAANDAVRMSQPDGQVWQPGCDGLRIVEHDLSGHGSALFFMRIIHSGHPVVGPL